jgi:hypothetical protein
MGDDYDDYEPIEPERPRDRKIDAAKAALMEEHFKSGSTNVYYARQLEIWQEKRFFHWITSRALRELAEEREIGFDDVQSGTHRAHFYRPFRHRYPRRQITEILKLIAEFSDSTFTRALGRHGEMLVESGLARTGFRILQQKVRAVDGVRWTESNHDLDFLIVRDGVRYGDHRQRAGGRHRHRSPQPLVPWASCAGVRRPTANAVPLSAGSGRAVHAMIKIAITQAAFEAIASTLPLGSV